MLVLFTHYGEINYVLLVTIHFDTVEIQTIVKFFVESSSELTFSITLVLAAYWISTVQFG